MADHAQLMNLHTRLEKRPRVFEGHLDRVAAAGGVVQGHGGEFVEACGLDSQCRQVRRDHRLAGRELRLGG